MSPSFWKNGAHRIVQCTNLQFVKIAIYVNHSKAKHNNMLYACVLMLLSGILYTLTIRFIWSIVYSNSLFPY